MGKFRFDICMAWIVIFHAVSLILVYIKETPPSPCNLSDAMCIYKFLVLLLFAI